MKIAVYAICKDEVHNVADWMKSAADADFICLTDTGSKDGTLDKFYDCDPEGNAWIQGDIISIDPWRFDDARNAALAHVPSNADVCISLDLDERLPAGWRQLLETKWDVGKHTSAYYTYIFSPQLSYQHNRIHARKGFRWVHPDHEAPYRYNHGPVRIHDEIPLQLPELVITQINRNQTAGHRSGILERLQMGLRENPDSARMTFHLGRELMYLGRYREALKHLERYPHMAGTHRAEAIWNAEAIANCWRNL